MALEKGGLMAQVRDWSEKEGYSFDSQHKHNLGLLAKIFGDLQSMRKLRPTLEPQRVS